MAKSDRKAFEVVAVLLGVATFICILISVMGVLLNLAGLIDKPWLSVLSPAISMLSLDVASGIAFIIVMFLFEGILAIHSRFLK